MSILESVELAIKNIVSSKTRTFLTMLGIIIGVAAVIVIVGLGNGLEQYVTDSFSGLGTNTLTVTVMSRGSTRTLSVNDMYAIVDENSQYLDLCSPTVTMPGSITQTRGGTADGNTVTFEVQDITQENDMAVYADSNHIGVIIAIVMALILILGAVIFFGRKKGQRE